ncbi:MAG: FtsX-like permease family protein [Candidatus Solibacter usitatus]|nr:FtsX-like permease family protein [Candidatus Solibacter usitatus]
MLFRLLTLPYVRKHKLRTALTVAGVALGVIIFVAMRTANDSVLYGFQKTVDRITGKAQLQITSGDGGFPEEILERAQAVPEVEVAVPVIEANAGTGKQGQGNLFILAVDMTGDRSLRDYDLESGEEAVIDDPLVFLAQPDSIMITREYAAQNGITSGSKIALETMQGRKQFTVRGIMKPGGLAGAFGGNLAIMDIYAAQNVFGRGRTFDRIDLSLKPGVSIDQGRAAVERALGNGLDVETPASRGKQFESITKIFSIGATLNSLFALLIGLFIIYNTFAVAVAQRRPEIGVLRSLGATRRQVRGLLLIESVVLGIAGSAIGIVLGLAMARGMARYIGTYISDLYGLAQHTEEITADPFTLSMAFAAGLVTSVIAACIPAQKAAQVDPVSALRKGSHESFQESESRKRILGAFTFASIALIFWFWGGKSGFRLLTGYLSVVAAAVLLTPAFVRLLVRWMRPVLRLILPVEGALAADSLMQAPKRTSATVAALMLSISLVIGLGGVANASYASITDWMNAAINPDLFVGPSEQISERSFRFSASLGDEMRAMDFVEEVQSVRTTRVRFDSTLVMVVATDMESLSRRAHPKVIAGDARAMFRDAAAGKAVILADNLAMMHNLKLGDTVEIPSPAGILKLPVAGIILDYSDQQGALLMDRTLYIRNWGDDTVNVFRVYLKHGVAPEAGKRGILEKLGDRSRLFVMTNAQVRAYITKVIDQWFGLTYMQIFVAVLVAVLGIVNSLTVSITDRRRELGVLQAVGGLRRQVRQAIWMEAAGIGAVSILLGLALGAIILAYYLGVIRDEVAGIRLEYTYPFGIAALMIPFMMAVAWASALGPGESAVRASLVEALEYE